MTENVNETVDDIISDVTSGRDEPSIEETPEVSEAQTQEQPTNEDTTPATAEVGQEESELNLPKSWDESFVNYIKGMEDTNARNNAFNMFKNLHDGYFKKFDSLAAERKEFEANSQSFEEDRRFLNDYRDFENRIDSNTRNEIFANYGSMPQYMHKLHQMDVQASQDPIGFIQNYMNNTGLTVEMLQEGVNSPEYQQRVMQSQQAQSYEDMRNKIMAEMEDRFKTQNATNQYNSYLTAKDEAGNLKYPHMQNMENDIAYMMTSRNMGFEDAYAQAKLLHADLFKEQIETQAKAEAEKERAKVVPSVKATPKSTNT